MILVCWGSLGLLGLPAWWPVWVQIWYNIPRWRFPVCLWMNHHWLLWSLCLWAFPPVAILSLWYCCVRIPTWCLPGDSQCMLASLLVLVPSLVCDRMKLWGCSRLGVWLPSFIGNWAVVVQLIVQNFWFLGDELGCQLCTCHSLSQWYRHFVVGDVSQCHYCLACNGGNNHCCRGQTRWWRKLNWKELQIAICQQFQSFFVGLDCLGHEYSDIKVVFGLPAHMSGFS